MVTRLVQLLVDRKIKRTPQARQNIKIVLGSLKLKELTKHLSCQGYQRYY